MGQLGTGPSETLGVSKAADALELEGPTEEEDLLLNERQYQFKSNLSEKAAKGRLKQAKFLGLVVFGVEGVISMTGSLSLWPHLVSLIPGFIAVQRLVESSMETCVMAAFAGVGETSETDPSHVNGA